LKKEGIVEENLEKSLAACFGRRVEKLTRTSTFLLRFRFECALTIFLTVTRGYNFWPAAIAERGGYSDGDSGVVEPGFGWEGKGNGLLFSSALSCSMKAERYRTGMMQPIKFQRLNPYQTRLLYVSSGRCNNAIPNSVASTHSVLK
jgi:hypothetical protein